MHLGGVVLHPSYLGKERRNASPDERRLWRLEHRVDEPEGGGGGGGGIKVGVLWLALTAVMGGFFWRYIDNAFGEIRDLRKDVTLSQLQDARTEQQYQELKRSMERVEGELKELNRGLKAR